MIKKVKLKSGSTASSPNLEFNISPITIFVGPNNSGKSVVLREIENYCRKAQSATADLILSSLEFIPKNETEFRSELNKMKQDPRENEIVSEGSIIIEKLNAARNRFQRHHFPEEALVNEAKNPNNRKLNYYVSFINYETIRLDGKSRMSLVIEQKSGDLQKAPENLLQVLFKDNNLRNEVRRIVFDAFNQYFVVDPTKIGSLRIRLSQTAPATEEEERGWTKKSVDFHSKAKDILDLSDGVKAFTGIIMSIIAGNPKIILLDEPEAFLHPNLSFKLGKEIATSLRSSEKKLFAATHSSNFLMGLIQSGVPINIIRLTYQNNSATSRILPQEKVLPLMRNPLLRSSGVLNGLFYQSVVVTEADSDRAFYQEINERLLNENDNRGIVNCLFLNAQNKQTVWDIVKPLRELGIPSVGIVDIDIIKDGGAVWTKLLNSSFIPQPSQQAFHNQRSSVKGLFDSSGKNMKRDGGIEILAGQNKQAAIDLFDQLNEYGVFVVRNGELESWLLHLAITGHGPNWLIKMFERMKDDPSNSDYVRSTNSDVWNFIGEINKWLKKSTRKGIPS